KTTKQMLESLLNPNWRNVPTLCDIPANSQIFGQLVLNAGIEGILYPSKLTGDHCLAIFPVNFAGSSSYVELGADAPTKLLGPRRIDAGNWESCDRTSEALASSP